MEESSIENKSKEGFRKRNPSFDNRYLTPNRNDL